MTEQGAGQGANWSENPFVANGPLYGDVERTLSNRPAQNAHVATPDAALQNARDWQAASGATDFLGLDQELASLAPNPIALPAPPVAPQAATAVADESWLLEMSEEHAAHAPQVPEPAQEPSASALLNTAWQEGSRPASKSSRVIPLVACAAIGALALAGVMLMRNDRDAALEPTHATSEPQLASTSKKLPATAIDTPSKAIRMPPTNRIAAPEAVDITPPPPERELAAPVDVASNVAREPSETRTAVETPDGIESLVEVVPPASESAAFAVETASSSPAASEPIDGATTETVAQSEEPPAATAPASIEPSASDALAQAPAAIEAARPASEPSVAPAESPIEVPAETESALPGFDPSDVLALVSPASPTVTESTPLAVEPDASQASAVDATPPPADSTVPVSAEPVVRSESTAIRTPQMFGPPEPALSGVTDAFVPSYGPPTPASFDPAPADAIASELPTGVQSRTSQLDLEQVLLLDRTGGELRAASVKDMSGVWSEPTIPVESIGAASKVLTPAVGKVRVILTGGEIFEGALYAVGEGCVWLDTPYGRMGLAGTRVKSVAQIDGPKDAPALGSPGSQDLNGLERVRIKTPGGVLYGKIIDRDEKRTTVITDDGARLTLDTQDVELLSQLPTVTIKKQ